MSPVTSDFPACILYAYQVNCALESKIFCAKLRLPHQHLTSGELLQFSAILYNGNKQKVELGGDGCCSLRSG